MNLNDLSYLLYFLWKVNWSYIDYHYHVSDISISVAYISCRESVVTCIGSCFWNFGIQNVCRPWARKTPRTSTGLFVFFFFTYLVYCKLNQILLVKFQEKEHFDAWELKKSILNTLFQAVKAITGGVTAIKGQLIKGSGYALSHGGKVWEHFDMWKNES